ncbi:MAG: hypothetical protein CVU56_27100 [Deltaproteobacteria bacterium HGW-Deltaproteobacteria-14]|jgi:PAS domain S-box-containing protein|nr:MAG: hypothetical protein CVU56_27100 [Deltaproteobacteria bacterium HGW-Deltaproteobacteria-14]
MASYTTGTAGRGREVRAAPCDCETRAVCYVRIVVSPRHLGLPSLLLVLLLATAYFAAGVLGLELATTHGSVTLVWAPTGIALAALLLGGLRLWPGVLLGALAVNAFAGAASPPAATMIAAGNTLEAIVGAYALGRVRGWSPTLERPQDLVAFTAIGVLAAPLLAAGAGVAALVLARDADAADTVALVAQWWVGDACGALIVTPLVLAWGQPRPRQDAPAGWIEPILVGGALVAVSVLAWRTSGIPTDAPPIPAFVALPFVVWSGLRYGLRGAATATWAAAAVAVWVTNVGAAHGAPPVTARLIELWLFVGVVSVSGLLAAVGGARHRVAAELADSEQRYRTLVESSPTCIHEFDLEGRILAMNRAGLAMIGLPHDQLVGTPMLDLFPPATRDVFARQLDRARAGEATQFELTVVDGGDGQERWFINTLVPLRARDGQVVRIIGHSHEVTNARRAEQAEASLREQLLHAQKLESLGVLAGGIAHDFNNLIAVVLGHAELVRGDLPADHPIEPSLAAIELASERAADLCGQMLAYSGRARFETRTLDVAEEVRAIGDLLRVSLPKGARLVLELDPRPIAVEADPSQLRQVVMNLITNAADAVTATGSTIRIRTDIVECDAATIAGWPLAFRQATPGTYARIEVEDDGAGMTEATRARLFDPFFTTKAHGRGLGLATTLGIARGHGGAIEVVSAPGAGARFRVLLPASTPNTATAAAPAAPAPAPSAGRDATVMVVDDEDAVRRMAARVLERAGYRVVTATDGLDALEQIEDGRHLDAILLDVTMPRLDGHATLARLRVLRPELPVILTSGYAEPPGAAAGTPGELAGVPFLRKPWRQTELLEFIAAAVRHDAHTG